MLKLVYHQFKKGLGGEENEKERKKGRGKKRGEKKNEKEGINGEGGCGGKGGGGWREEEKSITS